ncbi:hypothetical protein E3T39_09240 [Cryobacterium suzukii]|uniref:Type II secretion system protein n=1 Tax=Cryobacterium suzukii TaxID=1259198 RepID=A0A4R9AFB2_9MICO|nr:hypothetical protein [Cryobacterium suzukii]TFD59860.1 hypothetical protein E3T39_09240 [Cryobacterium suzukii]
MSVQKNNESRPSDVEDGFGMIEIVVSMLLLSLLAIAFLPMLVTSLRVSVSNSTVTSATQLVAAQMETIRSLGSVCGPLSDYAAGTQTGFDPSDPALQARFDTIVCPGPDPVTVQVRVYVTDGPSGDVLADAVTSIFVAG